MTSTTIPPEDERLLPCPFCGAQLTLYDEAPGIPLTWDHPFPAECPIAGLAFRDKDGWNRRSQPDSDREAIIEETLEKAIGVAKTIADHEEECVRNTKYDERWGHQSAADAATAIIVGIRSLKHSDTTSKRSEDAPTPTGDS